MQRLRVRFQLSAEAAKRGQQRLDRVLEEAAVRAALPVARSEGQRPRMRIEVGPPLPQDVSSDWELADILLTERLDTANVVARLNKWLPQGTEAVEAREVALQAPSITADARWSEYDVEVPSGVLDPDNVERRIEKLMAADSLPWEQKKEKRVRTYDLRALILDLQLAGQKEEAFLIRMKLRNGPEGSGRPDQALAALDLPPAIRIHKRYQHLRDTQKAVAAYKRSAERERF